MDQYQIDLKKEAIGILTDSIIQSRDEFRQIISNLIPVLLAIVAASLTISSTDFISNIMTKFDLCFLLLGSISLILSSVFGVIYLVVDWNKFRADQLARALFKLDQSQSRGKSDQWTLALAELSNRRALSYNQRRISIHQRFREALEQEKNNLQSWKGVKNPEKFYSTKHAELVRDFKLLFFFFTILGVVATSIFFIGIII